MKKSMLLLVAVCGIVAAQIIYLNHRAAKPVPVPSTDASPAKTTVRAESIEPPARHSAPIVLAGTNKPAPTLPSGEANSAKPAWSAEVARAIDILVSPQSTHQQRQEVWKQLRTAGRLDEALEALKQGMAANPDSGEYPAMLGQAELQKANDILKSGGKISDMGILGMQADQNFDAALKLDPMNWEAQFSKATAMSYWPPELNKGDEVIQRLSSLIDQQEAMPSQPEFAQPYAVLGDQYQKAGKADYAAATWQLGASRFPNDPALQKRINSVANQ